MGFHDFLNKCETFDSEPDVKLPHTKLSARDIQKMKVSRASLQPAKEPANSKIHGDSMTPSSTSHTC